MFLLLVYLGKPSQNRPHHSKVTPGQRKKKRPAAVASDRGPTARICGTCDVCEGPGPPGDAGAAGAPGAAARACTWPVVLVGGLEVRFRS